MSFFHEVEDWVDKWKAVGIAITCILLVIFVVYELYTGATPSFPIG